MPQVPFFRWIFALAPVRLWALIVLSIFALAAPGPIVWVLVYGSWPADTATIRITILGYAIYSLLAIAGIGMAALAMVKVHAKTIAGEITVEGDDEPPHATATVTVEAKAQ